MIVRVLLASLFYQVNQPFLLGAPIAPVLSNNVRRVKFKAIIWKHSQTSATIGTIEGYPRKHHSYSSNRGAIRPGLNAKVFVPRMGKIRKRESPFH